MEVDAESRSYEQEFLNVDPTRFKKDYFALFPTAFLSYQLPHNQELQVNYTRRLSRPWGGQMNSFKNISDSTNI
ncbi:MAG: outer membrane beta-barrel protein, partial [Bacteroidaceae bacterium]|nr:outer membrane beta-barrel protein [Bacteroidaceae bacterium]